MLLGPGGGVGDLLPEGGGGDDLGEERIGIEGDALDQLVELLGATGGGISGGLLWGCDWASGGGGGAGGWYCGSVCCWSGVDGWRTMGAWANATRAIKPARSVAKSDLLTVVILIPYSFGEWKLLVCACIDSILDRKVVLT